MKKTIALITIFTVFTQPIIWGMKTAPKAHVSEIPQKVIAQNILPFLFDEEKLLEALQLVVKLRKTNKTFKQAVDQFLQEEISIYFREIKTFSFLKKELCSKKNFLKLIRELENYAQTYLSEFPSHLKPYMTPDPFVLLEIQTQKDLANITITSKKDLDLLIKVFTKLIKQKFSIKKAKSPKNTPIYCDFYLTFFFSFIVILGFTSSIAFLFPSLHFLLKIDPRYSISSLSIIVLIYTFFITIKEYQPKLEYKIAPVLNDCFPFKKFIEKLLNNNHNLLNEVTYQS